MNCRDCPSSAPVNLAPVVVSIEGLLYKPSTTCVSRMTLTASRLIHTQPAARASRWKTPPKFAAMPLAKRAYHKGAGQEPPPACDATQQYHRPRILMHSCLIDARAR
jgi:hypothetical protein